MQINAQELVLQDVLARLDRAVMAQDATATIEACLRLRRTFSELGTLPPEHRAALARLCQERVSVAVSALSVAPSEDASQHSMQDARRAHAAKLAYGGVRAPALGFQP